MFKDVPILDEFEWQQRVADKDLTTPPPAPAAGARYIVAVGAIGDWLGLDGAIVWWNNRISQWVVVTPHIGWKARVLDEDKEYRYTGTAWVIVPETDELVKSNLTSTPGFIDSHLDNVDLYVDSADDKVKIKPGSDLAGAVTNSHVQGTDQFLDEGGANEVTAADAKDAVDKKHTQGTDLGLDTGGTNPITAATIKGHVDDVSTNPHSVTPSLIGAIPTTEKGAINGVATLGSDGKVPLTQLPNSVQGGITVIGFWDADTNSPDLSALTLNQGEAYQVSVAGNTVLNGESNWAEKDLVVWDDDLAGNYFKIDNTDDVISVNGQTGVVVLNTDHINEGVTNEYYTEAKVSANTDVAANTAARHDQNSDTLLDEGNTNEVSAADVRAHLDNLTKHREINDAASGVTDLWSASKIASMLAVAGDNTLKVSADDTTSGYAEDKIIGTANKIVVTTINPGANEQLVVNIGTNVFDKTVNTLDDIGNGTSYARVAITELSGAGLVVRLNDGTAVVTAAEAKTAYDTRGLYIAARRAMRFDNL